MGMAHPDAGPHAVILLSNGYAPDGRVEKQAHTLALAGWRVSIAAWDRLGEYVPHQIDRCPPELAGFLADWEFHKRHVPRPVSVHRVQVRAGYATGRRLLRTIPRAWWGMWQAMRRLRPDVVQATDLDTLPLALAYRALSGAGVVFDAREYYPGMVRDSVGVHMAAALDGLERRLAPRADAVLVVGERLAARYAALGCRVWLVHNGHILPEAAWLAERRITLRREWGVSDDALLVSYVGMLSPDRLLAPLLEAVQQREDVWLAIAGKGAQQRAVERAAAKCSRIRFLGWQPLWELPGIVAAGDAVYDGLDPANVNAQQAMVPHRAYFAWAVGRPLIVSAPVEAAGIVQTERCGVILPAPDVSAVQGALDALLDADARAAMAACAHQLGQSRMNWRAAAGNLHGAFADALSRSR